MNWTKAFGNFFPSTNMKTYKKRAMNNVKTVEAMNRINQTTDPAMDEKTFPRKVVALFIEFSNDAKLSSMDGMEVPYFAYKDKDCAYNRSANPGTAATNATNCFVIKGNNVKKKRRTRLNKPIKTMTIASLRERSWRSSESTKPTDR